MYALDPNTPVGACLTQFVQDRLVRRERGMYLDPQLGFSLAENRTTGMWRIPDYGVVRIALKGGAEVPARVSSLDQLTFVNANATLGPTRPLCPTAGGILYAGLQGSVQLTAGGDPPEHVDTVDVFRMFPRTEGQAADLAADIRQRAVALAQGLRSQAQDGVVDLLSAFAAPLTVGVISGPKLIGIPWEREPDIKRWSDGQLNLLWGRGRRDLHEAAACDYRCTPEVERASDLVNFWRFCLNDLVIGEQGHGMFMQQVAQFRRANGEQYTPEEQASFPFNLLVAGQESTTALLTTTMAVLLNNPSLLYAAIRDRNLLMGCVWEVVRLWPAFSNWIRRVRTHVQVGGETLRAGELCLLDLAAANLDPSVFPSPQVFNPLRSNHKWVTSFGFGAHACPGMNLAILETCIAVEVLAQYVECVVEPAPKFGANDVFCCLERLLVRVK